ncbi:tRNA pseudouridine(38-40) synthase TruA [Odoribacter sp. OttesenSCG-928-L07]|nr:tRNA pseudouridine(38-40) synthase TruA [Odoribacter sp. OttesenSCG-928-L07]MDL2239568.1 tRNA pseudouridine(38-40) synthase TruA [Bacteroidales bacterium OttesenSCG-928-L14]MDL2241045.1 tRNA pseudouridine(38-40) synthase TruA [Bacteroidales bacterium OttesenSCG-928-K22]
MRYFLNLEYNGQKYHGWQIQPNANTVQAEIEQALKYVLRRETPVVGCGRTDTGVHASDFYLHFDIDEKISYEADDFLYKLNGILPEDIKIKKLLIPENNEIHARFSATERTYKYTIISEKDPFMNDFAYHFSAKLNLDLMNEACEILKEYLDFSCFSKVGTDVATNNCVIKDAHWYQQEHIIIFTITADRFLRNMVRAICGTMLEIGMSKITLDDFRYIIESKNRSNAGASVPAKGLCLTEVKYDLGFL